MGVNYTGTDGVVKSSDNQRLGASINLTPSFFDDLLNVSANVKGSYITNNYDGELHLGGAVSFNPTLPVHMNNVFGNYTTYLIDGSLAGYGQPGQNISNIYPRTLFR